MDHDKLNRLLQVLERTSASELEYADVDWKIRLVRGPVSRGLKSPVAPSDTRETPREATTTPAQTPAQTKHVITAGLTGTFYRSPAPDQAPFVSVGDTVHEGQTVAVVEAMKMLNTIEADCAGRVITLFADDGASVSPDSMLFAIEPLEVPHV